MTQLSMTRACWVNLRCCNLRR